MLTFAAVGRGEAAVGVPVGHVADAVVVAVVVAAVVDDGAAGSCCTQKQTCRNHIFEENGERRKGTHDELVRRACDNFT